MIPEHEYPTVDVYVVTYSGAWAQSSPAANASTAAFNMAALAACSHETARPWATSQARASACAPGSQHATCIHPSGRAA